MPNYIKKKNLNTLFFIHLKLEIVLAFPALNELKILTNNSAVQRLLCSAT